MVYTMVNGLKIVEQDFPLNIIYTACIGFPVLPLNISRL